MMMMMMMVMMILLHVLLIKMMKERMIMVSYVGMFQVWLQLIYILPRETCCV